MSMKRILLAWSGATAVLAVALLAVHHPAPSPAPSAPSVAVAPPAPVRALSTGSGDGGAKASRPSGDAGAEDFRARVEAALRIADPAARERALAAVLGRWLAADAVGLLKYLMAIEVENDQTKLDRLASALQVALAAVQAEVAASDAAQEAIRRLALYLARFDPEAALRLASGWLGDEAREAVSVTIARGLAFGDPQDGLALARRLASPLRRMQAFAAIGGVWAETDPAAALAWAASLAPTEQALALNAIMTAMARQDSSAAAAELAAAERAMADAYEARYRADLAALGLDQIDLANDEERYAELLEAGAIPPPTSSDVELLGDAARVVANTLADDGPTAAVAWAEALENDRLRVDAVKGALTGWSESDPAAAAAYATGRYADVPELAAAVYDAWTDSAAPQAAASAAELSDPVVRAAATAAVVQAWSASDPVAAAAWLDSLPDGERSDAMQLDLVAGLSAVDPVDAWTRAQAIQDPTLQYRALKIAFSTLVTQRPEIAGQLLAAAPLSAGAAERLRDVLAAVAG